VGVGVGVGVIVGVGDGMGVGVEQAVPSKRIKACSAEFEVHGPVNGANCSCPAVVAFALAASHENPVIVWNVNGPLCRPSQ